MYTNHLIRKIIALMLLAMLMVSGYKSDAEIITQAEHCSTGSGAVIAQLTSVIDIVSEESAGQSLQRTLSATQSISGRSLHTRGGMAAVLFICVVGVMFIFITRRFIFCGSVSASHHFTISYIHNLDGLKG